MEWQDPSFPGEPFQCVSLQGFGLPVVSRPRNWARGFLIFETMIRPSKDCDSNFKNHTTPRSYAVRTTRNHNGQSAKSFLFRLHTLIHLGFYHYLTLFGSYVNILSTRMESYVQSPLIGCSLIPRFFGVCMYSWVWKATWKSGTSLLRVQHGYPTFPPFTTFFYA